MFFDNLRVLENEKSNEKTGYGFSICGQGWEGGHFFEPPPPLCPENGTASASRLVAQEKSPPPLTPPSSFERPKSHNI